MNKGHAEPPQPKPHPLPTWGGVWGDFGVGLMEHKETSDSPGAQLLAPVHSSPSAQLTE